MAVSCTELIPVISAKDNYNCVNDWAPVYYPNIDALFKMCETANWE